MTIQLFLYDRKSRFGDAETPFLFAMRDDGFHIDDFGTNGILLPSLPSQSILSRQPLHMGGHLNIMRKFWTSFNLPGDSANRFGPIRNVGNWHFVACADRRIERDAPSFDSNQGMLIASFSWAEQTAILTGSLIG